jgi:hypothetical protein
MTAFIVLLIIAGLAVLLVLTVPSGRGDASYDAAQIEREAQEAKSKITAINKHAREAIMDEAFRRDQPPR